MLKRFQHFYLMKKKVSIIIFIISILIIVGYISSSELLSMKKKNVHSIIVPENNAISFIASGPIVSLLYNEGASTSTFDGNHYEGNKPSAKSPLASGGLFATNSDSNLTDSIMAPSDAIYDNRTLDSNNIDLLTKIIISSTYNTNRTEEHESSTKQFVLTAKMEPQILSGNWMFKVDQGIIKDFKAKFTMVRINGTERNIYELYNFRPDLKDYVHISASSSRVNIINAKIDIKLNDENIWKDVNCTIAISKDNIIKITLNSRLIENQFNNQPIYGIIESFEAKDGNAKTIEDIVDERSTKAVSESRSFVRTNTTQVIFEIIDSLKKESSHDIIDRNTTREGHLDQFYADADNLPYDMSRESSIAERHANVIIVKGADNPSNERFFYPQNLFVRPGSTITWLNQDSAIHTATSTNGKELITDYIFDTDFIQTGQSSKPITIPQQEGLISYYCKLHPFMTGTVTVRSTSDGTIDVE
jgi:plastocyanin